MDNWSRASADGSLTLDSGSLGTPLLSGSLRAFNGSALLSLLNMQRQTGLLVLHNQGFSAYILTNGGEVAAAYLLRLRGLPALFQALSWQEGEFTFFSTPPVQERNINQPLPVLQVQASLWLDRWHEVLTAIPSMATRIGVNLLPSGEVVIKPYQWSVLTHVVSEDASIAALANSLNLDPLTVIHICYELVELGLCQVYPPDID